MSPLDLVSEAVLAFNLFMLAYFLALNANYALLLWFGWSEIARYVKRRLLRDYETISSSFHSMPVSILVPAYDERPVIVDSIRSLLASDYRQFEVVVINDGSTDGTLEELRREFRLVPVDHLPRARLRTKPVSAVYRSPLDERLVVVDKHNGGKADALNAGLVHARYPLFCAVDSDTMLERQALSRLVREFQVRPETVACGGIVRIANGSEVSDSSVANVRAPRSLVVNLQIVDYLRAFLVGRTGWSRLGALLIISGAFGLFRRETVVAAGGYDTTTVGEDAELVVRLHHFCRKRGVDYKIGFIADPVCWTEAPGSLRALSRQRDRWQRGLIEAMWLHRGMLGRPRYGRVGLFAMPYFLVFEVLGPLIELAGYAAIVFSLAMGWAPAQVVLAFFVLALSAGMAFTFGALWIEEHAFQRYRNWRCLGRLVLAAVVENFGYRQWSTFVRARAIWSLMRGERHWGEMARTGFGLPSHRAEALSAEA